MHTLKEATFLKWASMMSIFIQKQVTFLSLTKFTIA